jgi:coenzyme PQQ biosynthesis probable peptidase PqqF
MSQAARLRLDNGLTVRLLHDAQAQEAAALLQVACGSDDEPPCWPGLAHLLEHLLFTGSARYTDAQRLMSWVPAQGGRLNATTRADRTAFFFSLPASGLEAGLARLVDMLAAPLFAPEAVAQEVEVIDAEYRLLRQDAQTLREVAQRHFFHGPSTMQRFHVGSRASFGEDLVRLRQAVQAFHRQRYYAGAMTLWLSGPQSTDALAAIARRCGALLPSSASPSEPLLLSSRLAACGDATVRLAGATQLTLTFALNRWRESDAGWCALLQQLLLDEAEGSLLACLRANEVCDGLSLQEIWRGGGAALLAIGFLPAQPHPELAALLEKALRQWFSRLALLAADQLTHYLRLAQRQFAAKSALDRLREQAFGFAPPEALDITQWQRWLAQLQAADVSRIWFDETAQGETIASAGFDFISAPFTGAAAPSPAPAMPPTCASAAGSTTFVDLAPLPLRFWPFPPLPAPSNLPDTRAPLLHLPGNRPAVLILRPALDAPISDTLGYALQAALRALSASLAHQGAIVNVERRQGIWQIHLSGEPEIMRSALAATIARLRAFTAVEQGARALRRQRQKELGEIPVRRLLNELPRWLLARQSERDALTHISWQAALVGGSDALHQQLARLLSLLPGSVQAAVGWQRYEPLPARRHRLSQTAGDTAIVLFCPLTQPDLEAQLAWRLLALIYQPVFFQRLRVEQQVGYVVSSHFHHVADRTGVLFALQSPQRLADALLRHIEDFLTAMDDKIANITADELAEKRERLWQRLQPDGEVLEQARQALAFPELASPMAFAQLQQIDASRLLAWHRALCNRAHWWQCATENVNAAAV